jgi:hypothetical protein
VPDNVLNVSRELFSIVAGTLVLLGAALTFAIRHRAKVRPGSSGHRPEEEREDVERIGPDGYIDSFANVVEEAGGGLPIMAIVIIVVVIISYFAYLILFWQPR